MDMHTVIHNTPAWGRERGTGRESETKERERQRERERERETDERERIVPYCAGKRFIQKIASYDMNLLSPSCMSVIRRTVRTPSLFSI
jgi:hypothetical protein